MHAVGSVTPRGRLSRIAACAISWLAAGALQAAPPAPRGFAGAGRAGRAGVRFRPDPGRPDQFGYRAEARPFSFKDETGNAAGYSVALCTRIADAMKADLGITNLASAVGSGHAGGPLPFPAVRTGRHALRGGHRDARPAAGRVVLHRDLPGRGSEPSSARTLRPACAKCCPDRSCREGPAWRGNAGQILQSQTFSVVRGTTGEPSAGREDGRVPAHRARWLRWRATTPASASLLDRAGERALRRPRDPAGRGHAQPIGRGLAVIDRLFTLEPLALAVPAATRTSGSWWTARSAGSTAPRRWAGSMRNGSASPGRARSTSFRVDAAAGIGLPAGARIELARGGREGRERQR